MQRTVLSCVPNAEDGAVHAVDVYEQLIDVGWTQSGIQRVLYHLHDMGLIRLDEMGYYRP